MTAGQLVFTEPLACAVHGIDVLSPPPGGDVLVLGAGPTGLLLTQLLRNNGAARLTVLAPTAFKLELAAAFGADETIQVSRMDTESLVDRALQDAPDGYDVVVDATGQPDVQQHGPAMTRDGGTFFVYGMAPEEARLSISPYDIFRRELTIKGSFAQAFAFDRALRALRNGRVAVDDMVTHVFGIDQYPEAIHAVERDRACLKAVVRF
jgi:D-arabinitol dehydrogenase (NADP+)